ncbi:MAG: holo-[acyl-carrier-protein] synthase [Wolbachia endosymbiont of Meromenopon meropis]|nr:holo-[acyl-carrier-protein] synthase [Wolbachia endosymbiont of Meromenopon meropis]
MISGIGIDIIYVPRILKLLHKYNKKFLNRVYTEREIEISRKYNNQEIRAKYFAKRFAAKEAFVKALGSGFSLNLKMKDIEIYSDTKGKPHLAINKNSIFKNHTIHLSLSDDGDYAIAFVVICN